MKSRQVYLFGPFRLHVSRRLLLNEGQTVGIGSRAFDLLVALLARAGEVVSPTALTQQVWPDTVVEPSSLRVHIAALRKTLGPAASGAYIQNVPTRGYSFVAPVQQLGDDTPAADDTPQPPPGAGPLPVLEAPALVGRAALVRAAADKLQQTRCLSLVGPPGIGKTSLALHVRQLVSHERRLDSVLLDLAPLANADNLMSRLAASLGVDLDARDPLATLAVALRSRPLLVLDNCEHLVGAVAPLLEQLRQRCDTLHLLVTSREPLRILGESVMRIPALDLPPEGWTGEAGDVVDADAPYAAVALFLQRADECNDGFRLQPGEAAIVGAICRRLDGVPLAIELAAASTPAFSLRQIAERLDERLSLLVHGRRTALPRHRTLRAAIAWSYDLLPEAERQVLQCLACFAGWFSLEAAEAVCPPVRAAETAGASEATDAATGPGFAAVIHSLVSKSLLVVGGGTGFDGYRLLESVREFARERLRVAGQADAVARRHAVHLLHRLDLPEAQREQLTREEWQALFAGQLDDLRSALAWACGDRGDAVLAVRLTAASVPVWLSMALLGEFLGHAERAVERLAPDQPVDVLEQMRLHTALGLASWHVHGATAQVRAAFERAGQLAAQAGNRAYQLRAIWGLALACNASGDYAGSRQLALEFGELIGPKPSEPLRVTHGLMLMLAEHLVGRHAAAESEARRVLQAHRAVAFVGTSTGTQFDPRIAALALHGRLHWIQGRADAARQCCDEAMARARALDHTVSICFAVAVGTAPVAHWLGDLARARLDCELMMDRASRHALRHWLRFGEAYHLAACVREGALNWDNTARADLAHRLQSSTALAHVLCTISASFAPDNWDALLPPGTDHWCAPELLRVQALQRQARTGAPDEAVAPWLEDAVQLAREQQALAWELRGTRSLAEVLNRLGRRSEAQDRLGAVLGRLHEGRDTADLREAQATLDTLRG